MPRAASIGGELIVTMRSVFFDVLCTAYPVPAGISARELFARSYSYSSMVRAAFPLTTTRTRSEPGRVGSSANSSNGATTITPIWVWSVLWITSRK